MGHLWDRSLCKEYLIVRRSETEPNNESSLHNNLMLGEASVP